MGGLRRNPGAWSHWISQVLQLLRIMGQILRFWLLVPNFVWLFKGMITGLRSILVTLLMLCTMIFSFAVVFVKLETPSEDDCFDSVLFAMHCLMIQGIFADQQAMVTSMLQV